MIKALKNRNIAIIALLLTVVILASNTFFAFPVHASTDDVEATAFYYGNGGTLSYTIKTHIQFLTIWLFRNNTTHFPTGTRTGYTLTNWSKTLNGSPINWLTNNGRQYYDMGSSDGSFYAIWSANNYTLSFNFNGGGSSTSKTVTYDSPIGDLPAPIRIGYTFSGWKVGTTTIITPSTVWNYTVNQTAIAQWEIINYTLFFNFNGATGTPTEKTVTYGSLIDLPAPTRAGYTFLGWKIGDDTILSPSITWNYTSNQTATAQWETIFYTVTFDIAGGNISQGSAVQTVAMYSDAIPPSVSRDGYVFSRWDTSYSNVTDNRIITAVWLKLEQKEQIVNVNYIADGAVMQGSPFEKVYIGTSFAELNLPFVSKEGYIFSGWYLEDTKIDEIQENKINGDVTLTARFEKIKQQPSLNFFQRIWRWVLSLFGVIK